MMNGQQDAGSAEDAALLSDANSWYSETQLAEMPTDAMIEAGRQEARDWLSPSEHVAEIWTAMFAARPRTGCCEGAGRFLDGAQHTPGPWFAATGSSSYDIADQDGRLLARLWGDKGNYPLSQFADSSYLTHDQHVANAHLFAAAPDLYDVAVRILDRGYVSACIEEEREDHRALAAAIAKARGEA